MFKYFSRVSLVLVFSLIVFQTETFAAGLCRNIFEQSSLKQGSQKLHEKDSKLHTSSPVEEAVRRYKAQTGQVLTKPADKLNQWLNHLTNLAAKAERSLTALNIVKKSFHNQYVIKKENISESYYNLQVRIARERGYGDVTLTQDQRNQLAESVIEDQKKSLDLWTEYLVSKDTNMYPMWVKLWMFTGMVKLSKYDPSTGTFSNRDKSTVAPFVEINREALGLVVDDVLKTLNKESLKEINDPTLQQLLTGLNFGKIYGYHLSKLGVGKEGSFKTNEGRWVVYKQGSDHMPLVKSLEGQNTGWCTAGASTAQEQLSSGNFHVYYSLDDKGEPTIPRVAIRMQNKNIAEIRGVAVDQNLDTQINQSTVVKTKMKEFGSKADRFNKKDSDMRQLTQIDNKHKSGVALSKDDLMFLYEFDSKIEGFGYEQDPRIEEIKSQRDIKSDYVVLYDHKYTRDEISTTVEEALSGKSKIYAYGLSLQDRTSPRKLKLHTRINSYLSHFGIVASTQWLMLPDTVNGHLNLSGLVSIEGVKLPHTINGYLDLSGLTSAKGLKIPDTVNGYLDLSGLTSAEGLIFPDTFNGSINLSGLTSAKGLKLPKIITGYLDLSGLTYAVGLKLPEKIGSSLYLHRLKSAEGLKLPDTINHNLNLNGLVSAKGLKLPDTINANIYFHSLTSTEGLSFPDTVNGSLEFKGFTSAEGLKLPNTVNGDIYFNNLTSAKGLKLPNTVKGNLYLGSLISAEGLKLPEGVLRYQGPDDIEK